MLLKNAKIIKSNLKYKIFCEITEFRCHEKWAPQDRKIYRLQNFHVIRQLTIRL